MAKRLQTLLEAAVNAPPTTQEVICVLQTALDGFNGNQNSEIFEGVFDDEQIQGKAGTRGTAQSSVKALLQFVDMLEKTNILPPQVNNLLIDFGRFVLHAELLTDKEDKQLQILSNGTKYVLNITSHSENWVQQRSERTSMPLVTCSTKVVVSPNS